MRSGFLRAAVLCAALCPAAGCVTYPPGWSVEEKGRDPYEGVNRGIFGFNRGVDRWVLEPLATGWDFIMPDPVERSIDKFFTNLQFPRRLLANLGQGEVVHAGSELGRFLLNTTVGIVGLFDPATHLGMQLYDEDFGQMFGRWGIPAGPYWVIPIFGPSNPRDGLALPFDMVLDLRNASPVPGPGLLAAINTRSLLDEQIEAAEEAALDLYVATRDAHIERRAALVRNEDVGDSAVSGRARTDDLYVIDIEDPAGGRKPAPDAPADAPAEAPAETPGSEAAPPPAEETTP
jgi:phospholipid-binding lipoprotein MlaA